MNLFLIAPYSIDPEFQAKKSFVESFCHDKGIRLLLAEKKQTNSSQSLNAEDTAKMIETADIFIADLSYERPSCYFEVGYIQSLKLQVHIIAKTGTLIHQVLNKESIMFYEDLNSYKTIITQVLSIGKDTKRC